MLIVFFSSFGLGWLIGFGCGRQSAEDDDLYC